MWTARSNATQFLKGIAHNLLGAFISRNNDWDGYWALGKLYAFASEAGTDDVTLELLNESSTLRIPAVAGLIQRYRDLLRSMLSGAHVKSDTVRSAAIALRFGTDARCDVRQDTWGEPFEARLTITDDKGYRYSAVHFGWCGVHDATRERRSARAANVSGERS